MANVRISCGLVRNMLPDEGVNSNVTGGRVYKDSPITSFQAILTLSTGTGTATVTIQASNDGVNWLSTPVGVITLSGATGTTDGFTTNTSWKYVRAVVSSLTGTGALLFCNYGV